MVDTTWANALKKITPYVFKIHTPKSSGTGFQILFSRKTNICGIATALHVIRHATEWEDPIKIQHHESGETLILRSPARVIFTYSEKDLAIILFKNENLPIKSDALELIEEGKITRQGIQVGWCGFPAFAPNDLCFFTGNVSAYINSLESYLVDGVAINGVSGGPAFYTKSEDKILVSGVVSEYIPNRATGESLPGVCLIKSVKAYQTDLKNLKSLDEAEKKAREESEKENRVEPDKLAKKPTSKKKTSKKKQQRQKSTKKK